MGFLGTFLLNKFFEKSFNANKMILEEVIENTLHKKIYLGDYSGIRLLGISLTNSKIIDKGNINSQIKAKNIYVGIKPFKSFSIIIGAKTVISFKWLPHIAESFTIQISPSLKFFFPFFDMIALIVPPKLPKKKGNPGACPSREPSESKIPTEQSFIS